MEDISELHPGASTHREVPLLVSEPESSEHDPASCPLDVAINTIGGRWKLHILRVLVLSGPRRYNALLVAIEGISAKELTRNLRELETAALVAQIDVESRKAYTLTPLGIEIEAPFRALGIFGVALAKQRDSRRRNKLNETGFFQR
ncbi:helix-turn-helix transcriptional regulator [Rhizobium sp. NZLR8]|uniref:winged helix-turn-helix transcriptional regulator n=1 Tax=Rhizobium sp. NZLR8 TaxID=2731104 RepID=UPI001C83282D|nr:helix-turn-helix domain-containing protein [Rhizobium sp. NZLR8]MBX5157545.1 helix-turn-helix transcriptional regulator [Rhizobium sp. NZLR8]